MPFIGEIEVPQLGDKVRIIIPTEPGFELEVILVARWKLNQLGVPNHINFVFLLPSDAFPLELARRVVILDIFKEEWTIHIKDGETTVFQPVTVDIVRD
jgi:hypothetical protein